MITNDAFIDAERITAATQAQFWWTSTPAGGAFNIARTIRAFERGGWPPSHGRSGGPEALRSQVEIRAVVRSRRSGGQDPGGGGCPPGRAASSSWPAPAPGGGRWARPWAGRRLCEAAVPTVISPRRSPAGSVRSLQAGGRGAHPRRLTEFGKTELFDQALALHSVDMVLCPERAPAPPARPPQCLSDASR